MTQDVLDTECRKRASFTQRLTRVSTIFVSLNNPRKDIRKVNGSVNLDTTYIHSQSEFIVRIVATYPNTRSHGFHFESQFLQLRHITPQIVTPQLQFQPLPLSDMDVDVEVDINSPGTQGRGDY